MFIVAKVGHGHKWPKIFWSSNEDKPKIVYLLFYLQFYGKIKIKFCLFLLFLKFTKIFYENSFAWHVVELKYPLIVAN